MPNFCNDLAQIVSDIWEEFDICEDEVHVTVLYNGMPTTGRFQVTTPTLHEVPAEVASAEEARSWLLAESTLAALAQGGMVRRYPSPASSPFMPQAGEAVDPFEVDGITYDYGESRGSYPRRMVEVRDDACAGAAEGGCKFCVTHPKEVEFWDTRLAIERAQALNDFKVDYDPTIRF